MLQLFLIFFLSTILTSWFLKCYKRSKILKNIDGPRLMPLLGNGIELYFTKDWLAKFTELQRNHGDIVKVKSPFRGYTLIITDCEFAKFVLNHPKLMNKGNVYKGLFKWLGEGLLNSKEEKWTTHKKIIKPAFSNHILEQYIETFNSCGDILVNKLEKELEKSSFDVVSYLKLYTLDVICATAMGTAINAQENVGTVFYESVEALCRLAFERFFSNFKRHDFFYSFTADYQKEKRALKVVQEYAASVLKSRKQALMQNFEDIDLEERKTKSFLDILLEYKLKNQVLSDQDILDEVNTFMFGGFDTTATVLSFALYCIANNPHIQEKIVEELRNVFQDDKDRDVTYSDLHHMKYLEAVTKECMRLYPPVFSIARRGHEVINYDNVVIPKNSTFVIFIYGLHRNPTYYTDPEKFEPERFLGKNANSRPTYSYLPFSGGFRGCIGQKYAMLEIRSLLSKILRRYELTPAFPEHKLDLKTDIILKSANGIRIQIKKRCF